MDKIQEDKPKLTEERLEKFLNNYFKFHNVDISYKRNVGENYQDFIGNLAKAITLIGKEL